MSGLHSNPTKVNSTLTLENDREVLLTKAFELIKSYSDDYESSFEYGVAKEAIELAKDNGVDVSDLEAKLESLRIEKEST